MENGTIQYCSQAMAIIYCTVRYCTVLIFLSSSSSATTKKTAWRSMAVIRVLVPFIFYVQVCNSNSFDSSCKVYVQYYCTVRDSLKFMFCGGLIVRTVLYTVLDCKVSRFFFPYQKYEVLNEEAYSTVLL